MNIYQEILDFLPETLKYVYMNTVAAALYDLSIPIELLAKVYSHNAETHLRPLLRKHEETKIFCSHDHFQNTVTTKLLVPRELWREVFQNLDHSDEFSPEHLLKSAFTFMDTDPMKKNDMDTVYFGYRLDQIFYRYDKMPAKTFNELPEKTRKLVQMYDNVNLEGALYNMTDWATDAPRFSAKLLYRIGFCILQLRQLKDDMFEWLNESADTVIIGKDGVDIILNITEISAFIDDLTHFVFRKKQTEAPKE